MTDKQLQIKNFIADQELTKREIVKQFQHWHYHNSSKYIGLILSRMVKSGILEKPRIGVYRLRSTAKVDNSNQMNLF